MENVASYSNKGWSGDSHVANVWDYSKRRWRGRINLSPLKR